MCICLVFGPQSLGGADPGLGLKVVDVVGFRLEVELPVESLGCRC